VALFAPTGSRLAAPLNRDLESCAGIFSNIFDDESIYKLEMPAPRFAARLRRNPTTAHPR
jgi:hypothetical protein